MWVLVQIIGSWISPIKPAIYLWICVIVDTICLTLQAVGGGLAGAAASNYENPQTGTTIMVVGYVLLCLTLLPELISTLVLSPNSYAELCFSRSCPLCIGAAVVKYGETNLLLYAQLLLRSPPP